MSISVIIPTSGRATLKRAVDSVMHQLQEGDEVIIVGDGQQLDARLLYATTAVSFQRRYFECWRQDSLLGSAQRDYGVSMATGQWLAFLDDDDIYTKDALALMRASLPSVPDAPHLFKMQYYTRSDRVLWENPVFLCGNIGSPMIVVPNRPDLPKWFRTDVPNCFDWWWIRDIVESLYAVDKVTWHSEVVCVVRPTDVCAEAEIPMSAPSE